MQRRCATCNARLVQRESEWPYRFRKRQVCGPVCRRHNPTSLENLHKRWDLKICAAGQGLGKTCLKCGAPIVRKRFPNGRLETPKLFLRRSYCGQQCKPGRPLVANPGYSTLRYRARKHRKWLCEECGGWPVHAHHIDGNIKNHKPENIQTLCAACHNKKHPWSEAERNAHQASYLRRLSLV